MWQSFQQFSDINRVALESAVRVGQIYSRGIDRLAKQQIAFANESLSRATKQFMGIAEVRDPQQFLASQAAVMAEESSRWVDNAQKAFGILQETGQEFGGLFQSGWGAFTGAHADSAGASKATRRS